MLSDAPWRGAPLGWAAAGLALAFAGLNAAMLAHSGVRLGSDSGRYTEGADRVLGGVPPEGFDWAYTSYIGVVAAARALGGGLDTVVGIQILAAAGAGLALGSLGATLGGPLAGLFAAGTLLVNPDVLRWHSYILTDSLYTSAVVVGAWLAWRASERGRWWYLGTLLVLVLAWFLRPTGVVLLPLTGAYWAVRGISARSLRQVAAGVMTVAAAVMITQAIAPVRDRMSRATGFLLEHGDVFYRDPATRMAMPKRSPADGDGWRGALRYVARHPRASLTLAARRVAVELGHVRPHYSRRHNAAIVAMLLPLYALAVGGIAASWRHPLTYLLLAVIAAHLGLVAVTLADYDGRFLLHVLGPIAALAGAGLSALARRHVPASWTRAPVTRTRPSVEARGRP
jgi:hypothetical protein